MFLYRTRETLKNEMVYTFKALIDEEHFIASVENISTEIVYYTYWPSGLVDRINIISCHGGK